MPIIHDGSTLIRGGIKEWYRRLAAQSAEIAALVRPTADTAVVEPYKAQINAGRWCVFCPCGNVEVAWKAFHFFWCSGCFNHDIKYWWRPVEFPTDDKLMEIERILLRRPAANQNWSPNETIDQLKAENVAHGLAA